MWWICIPPHAYFIHLLIIHPPPGHCRAMLPKVMFPSHWSFSGFVKSWLKHMRISLPDTKSILPPEIIGSKSRAGNHKINNLLPDAKMKRAHVGKIVKIQKGSLWTIVMWNRSSLKKTKILYVVAKQRAPLSSNRLFSFARYDLDLLKPETRKCSERRNEFTRCCV